MGKINKNQTIVLDVVVVLIVFYLSFIGKGALLESILCFLVGSIFILSRSLKDVSYIYRFAYWTAKNIFKPKTIYNHIIWGSFFVLFGIIALLPIQSNHSRDNFLVEIEKTVEFWVGVVSR